MLARLPRRPMKSCSARGESFSAECFSKKSSENLKNFVDGVCRGTYSQVSASYSQDLHKFSLSRIERGENECPLKRNLQLRKRLLPKKQRQKKQLLKKLLQKKQLLKKLLQKKQLLKKPLSKKRPLKRSLLKKQLLKKPLKSQRRKNNLAVRPQGESHNKFGRGSGLSQIFFAPGASGPYNHLRVRLS